MKTVEKSIEVYIGEEKRFWTLRRQKCHGGHAWISLPSQKYIQHYDNTDIEVRLVFVCYNGDWIPKEYDLTKRITHCNSVSFPESNNGSETNIG